MTTIRNNNSKCGRPFKFEKYGEETMNTKTILAASLAAVFAVSMIFAATALPAQANPSDIPKGLKKVYQFNMIGYPEDKEYTGDCGQGARIFVNRDAHHGHIVVSDHNDGWHVADCNATADNRGALHSDDAGTVDLYVRILGKPGGHLNICANTLVYHDSGGDETLCLLGEIDLTRGTGKSSFSIQPDSIFDAELEDLIWSVDTNKDFRIAQFRVMEQIT